ncbi:TPA: hypothetical protein ACH3X1_016823 [Trebouxia sp. C0004]
MRSQTRGTTVMRMHDRGEAYIVSSLGAPMLHEAEVLCVVVPLAEVAEETHTIALLGVRLLGVLLLSPGSTPERPPLTPRGAPKRGLLHTIRLCRVETIISLPLIGCMAITPCRVARYTAALHVFISTLLSIASLGYIRDIHIGLNTNGSSNKLVNVVHSLRLSNAIQLVHNALFQAIQEVSSLGGAIHRGTNRTGSNTACTVSKFGSKGLNSQAILLHTGQLSSGFGAITSLDKTSKESFAEISKSATANFRAAKLNPPCQSVITQISGNGVNRKVGHHLEAHQMLLVG